MMLNVFIVAVRIYRLAVNLQGKEAFKEIALVSLVFLDSSCHLLREGFYSIIHLVFKLLIPLLSQLLKC